MSPLSRSDPGGENGNFRHIKIQNTAVVQKPRLPTNKFKKEGITEYQASSSAKDMLIYK